MADAPSTAATATLADILAKAKAAGQTVDVNSIAFTLGFVAGSAAAAKASDTDAKPDASKKPTRVLVVGAGVGGFTVAQGLQQACTEGRAHVTLVDASDAFQLAAGYQFVLTRRCAVEDISYRKTDYALAFPNLTRRFGATVTALDMAAKTATIRQESGSSVVPFDFVVLATGVVDRGERVPGLQDSAFRNLIKLDDVLKLRADLEAIESGDVLVPIAGMPYKCPPAIFEYPFLIDILLRERGVRDKVTITISHPNGFPFGSPAVAKAFQSVCKDKGIRLLPHHVVESITSCDGRTVVNYKDGHESVACDVLAGMAPQGAAAFLKDMVRPVGNPPCEFVEADAVTMRTAKHPDTAYAVGDCNVMFLKRGGKLKPHPKAGIFAVSCARTVAEQLDRISRGVSVADSAAAVVVGREGICFPEADYANAMRVHPKIFADKDGPFCFKVELPGKENHVAKINWMNELLHTMFGSKHRLFTPKAKAKC